MRPDRLLRAASFRLAILQTLLFLTIFALAGAAALTTVRRAELQTAHAEIEEYEDDLSDLLAHRGLAGLIAKVRGHRPEGGRDFRLESPTGQVLAGGLPAAPRPSSLLAKKYWSEFQSTAPAAGLSPAGRVLAYTRPEPDGLRLTVGEYLVVRERQGDGLLLLIAAAAILVASTGMVGGVLVGERVLRRVDRMARTIDRYAGGERELRIQEDRHAVSDLSGLAMALNRMMDRENALVEGLRQVSSSIAHDLRRPLVHHNQAIATALEGAGTIEGYRNALNAAMARVSEALETFQALLHIAELEAGAPGLDLESVDLDALAARVVEAYVPGAELGGRSLSYISADRPALLTGEPRVLGRMIANLLDNALIHTPAGTRVTVRVEAEGPSLIVSDNGPGVPKGLHGRLFERFYRLDASRSAGGSGLGLSLAAAAAHAFGGTLIADDANPGLTIIASFASSGPKAHARP